MAHGATTTRLHKNFYYLPSFKDTQFFRGENVKAFLLQQQAEWWQTLVKSSEECVLCLSRSSRWNNIMVYSWLKCSKIRKIVQVRKKFCTPYQQIWFVSKAAKKFMNLYLKVSNFQTSFFAFCFHFWTSVHYSYWPPQWGH